MRMIIEPEFLNDREATELIMLTKKFSGPAPQLSWPKGSCASSTAALSSVGSEAAAEIELRLAARVIRDPASGEGLRGVWYKVGEGYRMHHDAFHATNTVEDHLAGVGGNRELSALIYLNTINDGGETIFPKLGLCIQPRAGLLVYWSNLKPSGEPDEFMMHSAEAAKSSEKFIVQVWFRERPIR